MASTSVGYSITLRVEAPATTNAAGELVGVISRAGALVTALDLVESRDQKVVLDISCNAIDSAHVDRIRDAVGAVAGVKVGHVSDTTFLIHLGGKLEVNPKVPLRHRDDLSRAYTPGVARICLAIAEQPEVARNLTIKKNTVAVVTDGSAVLGLGNLGAAAALPVMEGKAALFKHFGNVDAWPVCLDTQDPDKIVEIVKAIAPVYGGINLEDIAAPRCFAIERRLRDELDIPVFHDDQHGTAIVVLAALMNALSIVNKKLADVRIVLSGVGAAGSAIIRLLQLEGARNLIACDRHGALTRARTASDPVRAWIGEQTNPDNIAGTLAEVLRGADIFIGVSASNLLVGDDIAQMADDAIVFALANPDPEVDPIEAGKHAAVVATGRSDFPNQINNVLAFPGVFRGLLDCGARDIPDEMLVAAARAIASAVAPEALNAGYVIPSVFDQAVAPAVAAAVRKVANERALTETRGH